MSTGLSWTGLEPSRVGTNVSNYAEGVGGKRPARIHGILIEVALNAFVFESQKIMAQLRTSLQVGRIVYITRSRSELVYALVHGPSICCLQAESLRV